MCPERVLSLQHQSGNYAKQAYRTKKETQAERIRLNIMSIHSNFSFIDIIWVEWLQREAGSDRWCRFQGIMLTPAAGINNLKEERNDPYFPVPLTYRISDFSHLTSCFNLPCHSKIKLFYQNKSHGAYWMNDIQMDWCGAAVVVFSQTGWTNEP